MRASGTEDAIRVYAEARTQQAADQLALDVSKVCVWQMRSGPQVHFRMHCLKTSGLTYGVCVVSDRAGRV